VQRIRIPWMFDVIGAIDNLNKVNQGEALRQSWFPLFDAKNQLEAVFSQSPYSFHLRVSRDLGNDLHKVISEMVGNGHDFDRVLAEYEFWNLKFKRDAFKPVFISEVSTLPSFLVIEKEGYVSGSLERVRSY
jgi:hypothetical protein